MKNENKHKWVIKEKEKEDEPGKFYVVCSKCGYSQYVLALGCSSKWVSFPLRNNPRLNLDYCYG